MSNEEILNELLKSTRKTQNSMNEMQNSMKILQEDVKELKIDVKNLNDKYTQLDRKVTDLDEKVTDLDGKVTNLDEKTTRIDGSVMIIEHEYTKKIDLIYENTVTFLDANYRNRESIDKLDKRVEKIECMMPIKPINQKEA